LHNQEGLTLMNPNALQKLIELVEFDRSMLATKREIEKLQHEIDDDKKEANLCQVGLEKYQELNHTIKKEVDAKELEMKSLDQEEKDKRKKMDGSTNQREYSLFSKEVEGLRKKQHDLEEDLLATWKKLEHAQEELKKREIFCDAKLTSLNTVIIEKMQEAATLKTKLDQHVKARDKQMEGIPEDLLEKYTAMYKQTSNPVVAVEKDSCSACFYTLTKQDVYDVRKGQLLQCKDCFRFIYAREAYYPEERGHKKNNAPSVVGGKELTNFKLPILLISKYKDRVAGTTDTGC